MLTTIPAHTFEPMKRANPAGGLTLIDAEECGYYHRIVPGTDALFDADGVFCAAKADHRVHHGSDWQVRVREWTEDEIEAMS